MHEECWFVVFFPCDFFAFGIEVMPDHSINREVAPPSKFYGRVYGIDINSVFKDLFYLY